ncbi:FAD-binding oxidoreductase [Aureimonas sp. AU22]|uniref:FAD-binding oxidoreductase n=1 Tax=Aureimonas sp. AU22 TaxID=1638162 RepID=UPI0009E7E797|nr:FAD-binding oxidoreductase [Aureimonas sp. AU22]
MTSGILSELVAIVGERHLVPGETLRTRPLDFWTDDPTIALALVKPGSTAEVSAVLALCDDRGIAVVAEGGRTNLNQGTRADETSLLLSLERLNAIGVPDEGALTIEAGAGAVVQTLQERCADRGLRFGLDFGARGSATLGGALATNAGGFQAMRYGVARDQVLGLECVLADGTVLRHLSPYAKDNTGYDLKQLFIGSEGTLGIITRAVLKLHPAPVTVNTALLAFPDFDCVTRTLGRLRRGLHGTLSSFEIMWPAFFELNAATLFGARRPLPPGAALYALCEAEGFEPDGDGALFEALVGAALEAGDVGDAVIAQSSRQRDEFWRIREDFEAEQALFPVLIDFDISLPLARMDAFVGELDAALRREIPDVIALHVLGHLGDGNLHLTTGLPTTERRGALKALVYGLVARYRGSISAEHGIGLLKRDYLHHSREPAEIATMRRLKAALDPRGTLNPGKVI